MDIEIATSTWGALAALLLIFYLFIKQPQKKKSITTKVLTEPWDDTKVQKSKTQTPSCSDKHLSKAEDLTIHDQTQQSAVDRKPFFYLDEHGNWTDYRAEKAIPANLLRLLNEFRSRQFEQGLP